MGQCGDSRPGVVGVPAEQRSAHFGVESPTARPPWSFLCRREENEPERLCWSPPSALLLPLLSFKETAVTPGWLPLILILSQLVFWQADTLRNQIVTLAAPVLLQMRFYHRKVAPDSGLSCFERARTCRLIVALSLCENTYQSLLFTNNCYTTYIVGEIIFSQANYVQLMKLFIPVWGLTRLLLRFLVLFIMRTVFWPLQL